MPPGVGGDPRPGPEKRIVFAFEVEGGDSPPARPRDGIELGAPSRSRAGSELCAPGVSFDVPMPAAHARATFPRLRRATLLPRNEILRMQRATLLSPGAVEDLAEQSPEVLGWLQTFRGLALQVGLLVLFVAVTPAKSLASKMAVGSGKVQPSALVMLNSAASIAIGFGVAVRLEGLHGAVAALADLQALRRYALVGALFALSMVMNILAFGTELDAGTIQVLGQLQLPMSALFSRLAFGRKYGFNQWMMLVVIAINTFAFFRATEARNLATESRLRAMTPEECFLDYDPRLLAASGGAAKCRVQGHPPPTRASAELGMLYVVGDMVTSVSASLMAERFLKAAPLTPFYLQKMQMEISGVWVCIASAFLVPYVLEGGAWDPNAAGKLWWRETTLDCVGTGPTTVGGNGLFAGFSSVAFVQLCTQIVQAWLGGIVVKQFSTVAKNLAKSAALVLTVCASELTFTVCWAAPMGVTIYLLSVSICASSLVFSSLG